jgi:hypothetical protein
MTASRPPLPTDDRPCVNCLEDALAVERNWAAVARHGAVWLLAFVFAATMLGTTLPTPLYVIYQGQWHFSSGIVTVIFAAYAGGVLAALLLAGRSSDQVGRRPVLATALGLSALSTAVFIVAPDLELLFLARILSGMSAGLMTGTGTAMLSELIGSTAGRKASLVATAVNMGGLGPWPPHRRAVRPVRSQSDGAGVRGVPGGPCCSRLRIASHSRDGEQAKQADVAVRRARDPAVAPGRVHRRWRRRFCRLLPAWTVQRARTQLPRGCVAWCVLKTGSAQRVGVPSG